MPQRDVPLPGEGWELGPDGLPFREAARVLLLDRAGRVLLIRAHDAQRPERSWWFTIGGGVEPGESPREAVVREVGEETGLTLDPAQLIGPVAVRSAVFDFAARPVRQAEQYFVASVDAPTDGVDTAGWTWAERSFLDEVAWFSLEELAAVTVEVFPAELGDLLESVRGGWDGTVRRLGDLA